MKKTGISHIAVWHNFLKSKLLSKWCLTKLGCEIACTYKAKFGCEVIDTAKFEITYIAKFGCEVS